MDRNCCANCGRAIGSLETAYPWQDHLVCQECHTRLSAASATGVAGSSNNPPPAVNNNYLLAALPHIGVLLGLGFIILPLVVMLAASDEFVRANAREALNFHITMFIYFILAVILCLIFIGFILIFALVIFLFVASIIATVQASQGHRYRYPLTIRMIS